MAKKWQKKFGVPVLKSWKQPCINVKHAKDQIEQINHVDSLRCLHKADFEQGTYFIYLRGCFSIKENWK